MTVENRREQQRGTVYQEWFVNVLGTWNPPIQELIRKTVDLPRSPFTITDPDVLDLMLLIEACNIDISDLELDMDNPDALKEALKDRVTFHRILGRVYAEIYTMVHEVLKPEDPYVALLRQLKEEDIRQMEGERA